MMKQKFMMRINQIWEELENDISFSHGVLLRRYSSTVLPDVFVALKATEKFRCIAALVNDSVKVDISSLSNFKDINVELLSDDGGRGKNTLLFVLINNQHRDIFSVLCEDLITSISTVTNEDQVVSELLSRFEKWKSLFERASVGLSPQEQRGLFGELFFIRKYLRNNSESLNIINSWTGPEKQIRDFQAGSWSVEVKTTHGNNHQKVHISSERQLDTSNLKNLFLYHISLETRQKSGETLNHIVESVDEILVTDFTTHNRFRNKLLEAGYFKQHRQFYENFGYFIREETFYEVQKDFPRIEEKDIRNGVGDVKYSIVISQCSQFTRSEQQVFQNLLFL